MRSFSGLGSRLRRKDLVTYSKGNGQVLVAPIAVQLPCFGQAARMNFTAREKI